MAQTPPSSSYYDTTATTPPFSSPHQTPFSTTRKQQQEHHHHAKSLASSTSTPTPLPSSPSSSYKYTKVPPTSSTKLSLLKSKDSSLKRTIRTLRLTTRLLSLLLSLATTALMSLTLHKFLTTRTVIRNNRTPWHAHTKLWPTTLNLALASLSSLINAAVVVAYLVGVKAANKTSTISTSYTALVMLANVAYWIAGSVVYRVEKDKGGVSDDVWGWSCSPAAMRIQGAFSKHVDFQELCRDQTVAWGVGIAEVGVEVLALGVLGLVVFRRRNGRRLRRLSGKVEEVEGEEMDEV